MGLCHGPHHAARGTAPPLHYRLAMSGLGAGRRLPGDDVLPGADVVLDRMLDLAGTPEQVWPWLEQLGKDRAGWYLPHVVEMVVPRSRRAARGIGSRWQGLQVGDAIPDWGPGSPSFEVLEIERPKHLVYWSSVPAQRAEAWLARRCVSPGRWCSSREAMPAGYTCGFASTSAIPPDPWRRTEVG